MIALARLDTGPGHGGGQADASPVCRVATRLPGMKLGRLARLGQPGESNQPSQRKAGA